MINQRTKRSSLLWCLIFFAACSNKGSDADSVAHMPIPAPEQCEAPYDTSIAAQPAVTEAIDVARYDVKADVGAIQVALYAADDTHLGDVNTEVAIDVAGGVISQLHVSTSYLRDDEVQAAQRWRVMSVGGSRTWIEVTNALDDVEFAQWLILDADFTPVYRALAFEVDEAGPGVQVSNGRQWDVLELAPTGDVADEAETWIESHVGTQFEDSEVWRVLTIVGNDDAPFGAIDAQLRACQTAATGAAHDEITRSSALCPAAESADTRRLASCPDFWFAAVDTMFTVHGVYGGIKTAATIAGVGALAFGTAGLGTIIAAGVVIWVMTSVIEAAILSNPDPWKGLAIDAVGGAFGEDTEPAKEFFTGGGGTSTGDPHLRTFDGLLYNFHNAGEFILVRSDVGEPFEVQTRQVPRSGAICPGVAVNTAVAIQSGASRVTISQDDTWVDGVRGELGPLTALNGGGYVERAGKEYLVVTPSGDAVHVRVGSHIDVSVTLSADRKGSAKGLLGNANGVIDDDIELPNGTVLPTPISWTDLRDRFGEAWRVTSARSLFDYADGESNSTFNVVNFPLTPTTLDRLPEDDRTRAEAACEEVTDPGAFVSCVIDVACTNDNSFVDSHVGQTSEQSLELTDPASLTEWSVQGDAGDWRVAPDGTAVTQQANGEPTFFVSGTDLFDVTVRGRIRNNAQNDDDIVGLVFGYQSPIDADGDPSNEFETFVLAWKAVEQDVAPEGFVLFHLNGVVEPTSVTRVFWENDESDPAITVIGRNTGEGRGWAAHVEHPFEVTYTADRLVVVVSGEEIFNIPASSSPVPFTSGRFGFYNYSQPSVRYHGLLIEPALDNPTESLEQLTVGTDRPGATYRTVDLDVADPRVCQSICRSDSACEAFVYRRPVFATHGASCDLKDRVPSAVPREGVISGLR